MAREEIDRARAIAAYVPNSRFAPGLIRLCIVMYSTHIVRGYAENVIDL